MADDHTTSPELWDKLRQIRWEYLADLPIAVSDVMLEAADFVEAAMSQPQSLSTSLSDAALRRVVHELRLSEQVFRSYGHQHQDKAEQTEGREYSERMQKAFRNLSRADACKEALDAFDAAIKSKEQSK